MIECCWYNSSNWETKAGMVLLLQPFTLPAGMAYLGASKVIRCKQYHNQKGESFDASTYAGWNSRPQIFHASPGVRSLFQELIAGLASLGLETRTTPSSSFSQAPRNENSPAQVLSKESLDMLQVELQNRTSDHLSYCGYGFKTTPTLEYPSRLRSSVREECLISFSEGTIFGSGGLQRRRNWLFALMKYDVGGPWDVERQSTFFLGLRLHLWPMEWGKNVS